MRRNFLCALMFALALAVQALAPAAAGVAMATAAQQLCVTLSSAEPGATAQPAGHSDAGPALCDLCALCCGAVGPIGTRSVAVTTAPLRWIALIWAAADDPAPLARRGHAGQARAPPSCS
jgi:hypothetical protein